MLAFDIADCAFLLDVGRVLELIAPQPAQAVPGTHPAVVGLLAWRQRSLPVLDLRAVLRGAASEALPARALDAPRADAPRAQRVPPGRGRRIVVLEVQGQLFGLLVDKVHDVVAVRPDDLLDDAHALAGHIGPWTLGCCRLGAAQALLLDVRPLAGLLAAFAPPCLGPSAAATAALPGVSS